MQHGVGLFIGGDDSGRTAAGGDAVFGVLDGADFHGRGQAAMAIGAFNGRISRIKQRVRSLAAPELAEPGRRRGKGQRRGQRLRQRGTRDPACPPEIQNL